jgi:hypothetical protein
VEKLRSKVVQELMSSEKAYLKQVGLIVTEFKRPLEEQSLIRRREMDGKAKEWINLKVNIILYFINNKANEK